jgi:GTP-binding protein
MIPCDTEDINKEYAILLNELKMYNPELLDKPRLLAITKCDLLDEELTELVKSTLKDLPPYYFISSVAQIGLDELKDAIWRALTEEN